MLDRHPLAELAPRDVVASAVVDVMSAEGSDHVWLDARALGEQFLPRRFPSIVASCRSHGIDPVTELVPVAPAQHYASGGVLVDTWGRTTIEGLMACGEVSASGVHGANRLASNSLLEGLVWGYRIVDYLRAEGLASPGDPVDRLSEPLVPAQRRPDLQAAMTAGVGVTRDAQGLAAAAATLSDMQRRADSAGTEPSTSAWEATNLHAVASVLTAAASARTESRGGHRRRDHPGTDDDRWRGRLVARCDAEGTVAFDFVGVDGQVSAGA
jgi:L-aspartate oxidase